MKSTQISLLFIFLMLISIPLLSQRAKRKNVKGTITHFPSMAMENVKSYTIKIYPGDNALDQNDLKAKKGLGSKIQAFEDKVNKAGGPSFYSYHALQSMATGADVVVEIGFGKFEIRKTEMVEWKIPCTYKGAKLKAENIMECPAYYYDIKYDLPVIVRISDNNGNVLQAIKLDNGQSTSFGQSELAGFLKKEELEAAYSQPGTVESLGRGAMVSRMEQLAIPLNTCFYFYDEEMKIEVASGTGSFDYPELDQAFELADQAYSANPTDEAKLQEAIATWENAISELNREDKKARVAPNLGMGLSENLATAYAVMNDYDKALESIDRAIELQQIMTNKTREPMLYDQRQRLMGEKQLSGNAEANKALTSGTRMDVGLVLTEARVKENEVSYPYLTGGNVYDEFNADYREFHEINEQPADETAAGATLGELLGGNKSYKERIMVMGANNNLILNDVWGDDLDALPEEICELTELTQLNLTDQPRVNTLPSCISNLSNLKKLNLWNNSLTSLPAEIGQLSQLEVLDVSNNQLTSLPAELKNCTNLKKLVVKGNKISNLDEITSAFSKLKVK